MNIKDFRPGQEVFGLTECYGWNKSSVIRRLLVAGVGRKYVKAAPEGAPYTIPFALVSEEDEYLTEAKDWGDKEKLFPSEQDLRDYQEQKELFRAIRQSFEWDHANDYSLGQLREIQRILNK